jgi:hypothetical protein
MATEAEITNHVWTLAEFADSGIKMIFRYQPVLLYSETAEKAQNTAKSGYL